MPHPEVHDHRTPQPHPHEHAPLPAPSRQGSVVLDIGAGTGALLIHAGLADDGVEIHVSPEAYPDRRTHAAVRPRHLPGRTLYSAVITPLPVGRYTVWNQDGTAHGTITVADGRVSDYHFGRPSR